MSEGERQRKRERESERQIERERGRDTYTCTNSHTNEASDLKAPHRPFGTASPRLHPAGAGGILVQTTGCDACTICNGAFAAGENCTGEGCGSVCGNRLGTGMGCCCPKLGAGMGCCCPKLGAGMVCCCPTCIGATMAACGAGAPEGLWGGGNCWTPKGADGRAMVLTATSL